MVGCLQLLCCSFDLGSGVVEKCCSGGRRGECWIGEIVGGGCDGWSICGCGFDGVGEGFGSFEERGKGGVKGTIRRSEGGEDGLGDC